MELVIAFDGANVWFTNAYSNQVTKMRASDGTVLGNYPANGTISASARGFDQCHWPLAGLGDYEPLKETTPCWRRRGNSGYIHIESRSSRYV